MALEKGDKAAGILGGIVGTIAIVIIATTIVFLTNASFEGEHGAPEHAPATAPK